MARVDSLNNFLTDVANSIRVKKGTTDTILASNFDNEIESIQTDPNLQSKSIIITSNGTQNVTADEGYDGLSDVSVTTNVPSGEIFSISNCNYLFQNNYRNNDIYNLLPFCSGSQNYAYMFYNSNQIESLDLSSLDVSNATSIISMFSGCKSLKNLKLGEFRANNATSLKNMFSYCSSLTNLDLSGFSFEKATSLTSMFEGCSSLTNLNLSGFSTELVQDMYAMFQNCTSLKNVDLSNFSTKKCKDMSYMFVGCSSLESLDVSNFTRYNYANSGVIRYMFQNCTSLKNVDLSNFNAISTTQFTNLFYNCKKMETIDLSSFTLNGNTSYSGMFYNCGIETETGLTTVYVKDEACQQWVLSLSSSDRPSTWSTANVIIKEV